MSVPGMDWKVFAVCMFAIAASWLIASIPLAHAAQVTISFGGSSQTTTYTPEGYINKQVTIDSATGDVRIQVSNSSSSSIDSVYVYKCQDRSPSACSVQVAPVSFSGNVDVTYAWNDVSDAARQTANIMLIVHAIGASGSRWLSFWSRGTKSAGAPPSYSMADSSISSIAITAKTIDHVTSIRSFIDIKGMLPMNPSWISSIVFSGAAGFHDIESSSPPAASAQAYYTGSSVTNIAGSYAFVFPYNGFFALNGITIANSSSYVCGDNACSASLGENSANCCLDCGVPSGYYCDMTMGPKQLGGISPSTSPSPIKVSNCNVPNTVSLLFTINNMPTGAHIVSAQYTLNGSSTPQASACTQSGNAFTCSITTPAVAGCTGTGYVLSPNSMALTIRFNNGNTSMTWGISTPIPQITVGSWTCGSFGCESNLGESQANCCYDCGCATGQYCDFTPSTQPVAGSGCRAPVSNANLRIDSTTPSPPHFYTHNAAAGDNVQLVLQITDAPQSVAVSSAGCRVTDCFNSTTPSGGLPCSASCSVSCTPRASTNPNIYNSTCTLNFRISNYDPLQNYSVYSAISNAISYSNGTGSPVSAVLETSVPVISAGAHFRGDGTCNPDESHASVCWDCPCPAGQYCDSANRVQFTTTDTCRQLSLNNVVVDSIGPTTFSDTSIQHTIAVSAHADNKPNGVSAAGLCSFNNSVGAPACSMACSTNETAGGYNISCGIAVPAMNYKTSLFYDNATRKLTLPNSSFSVFFIFNNGSGTAYRSASSQIPNIVIDVVPHCGDGACDVDIGESSSSCCLDCNCSAGMFCYGGVANGQCLDNNAVYLFINRTNPADLNCTIAEYRGTCRFVQPVDIYADIINVPVRAGVIASSYKIDNKSYDINCFVSPIGQNAKYICSTALPEIAGEDGGIVNKSLELLFTIRYSNNGTVVTKNITANASLGINRIKSDRVISCEQAIRDVQKAKGKVDSKKGTLNAFLAVAGTLAATACALAVSCCSWAVACWISCGWWIFVCGLGIALVGCIGGMLNSAVEKAKQSLEQAEQKKSQMCASSDPASMAGAAGGSKGAGGGGLGAALGILCAVGIIVAMLGAFIALSAAAPAAGAAAGTAGPATSLEAGATTIMGPGTSGTYAVAGVEGGIWVESAAGGTTFIASGTSGFIPAGAAITPTASLSIAPVAAGAPSSIAPLAAASAVSTAGSALQGGGGAAPAAAPAATPATQPYVLANPVNIVPDYTIPAVTTPSATAPYVSSVSSGPYTEYQLPPVGTR